MFFDLKAFQESYGAVYPSMAKFNEESLTALEGQLSNEEKKMTARDQAVWDNGTAISSLFILVFGFLEYDTAVAQFSRLVLIVTAFYTEWQLRIVEGVLVIMLIYGIYWFIKKRRNKINSNEYPTRTLTPKRSRNAVLIFFAVFIELSTYVLTFSSPAGKYFFNVIFFFPFYVCLCLIIVFIIWIIMLVLYTVIWGGENHFVYSSLDRLEALVFLANEISRCSRLNNFPFFAGNETKNLFRSIKKIAILIRKYPVAFIDYMPRIKMVTYYDGIAINFEKDMFELILKKHSNGKTIAERLIIYYNAYATGDFSGLPNDITGLDINPDAVKIRYYHYIFLVLYLIIPFVFVLFIIPLFTHHPAPDFNTPIGRAFYGIWCGIGLINSPVLVSNDKKDLIKDVLKTAFGKVF